MFSKSLVSSFASPLHHLAVTAAAALTPPFSRIILSKQSPLSTSTAGDDRPTVQPEAENTCPMADFLLNECGACQSEVSTIFKIRPSFVRTRSTQTAQQTVQFLRDSGFTEDEVRKLITQNPAILGLNADRQLKPKIEFIKTWGLTVQDLGNTISRQPRLLGSNLEKTLRPNIQYLRNLFGSEADVYQVLKVVPRILNTRNGPEIFEKRLKHLASFGLPEDEIKELVRRNTFILGASIDKVQKIMDFFIHTVGLSAKFLLQYPRVLCYSLEGTIKPRYRVLTYISAMQPSEHLPSLPFAIEWNEKMFLKRYVKRSPYATELLEMYSGKPVDLDSI